MSACIQSKASRSGTRGLVNTHNTTKAQPRPPHLEHKAHASLWDTSAKCGGAPWSNFQYDGRTLSLLLSTHFERRPESGLRPRCEVATCYSKPWNVAGGSFKLAFFQMHSCRNMSSKAPAMVSNPDTNPDFLTFRHRLLLPCSLCTTCSSRCELVKARAVAPMEQRRQGSKFHF